MPRNPVDPEVKRQKPLTSMVTEELFNQVMELAKQRRWTKSTAAGYLLERGLEAERKQKKKAA